MGDGRKVSPLTACVGMSKQVGFLLYETSDTASLSCLSVIKLDQYDPLLEKHLQDSRENPLLSIERETIENINFDNVIDEFATIKSRRLDLL